MGDGPARTSELSIETGVVGGRPVAVVRIDGIDVLEGQRPTHHRNGREYPYGPRTYDPARPVDLLPPDSAALLATAAPRHAMIGICQCGEPGCGSMWVRVRRDGDEVVWEPDLDTPGDTVDTTWRFGLRQYLDAVDDGQRSTASWETRPIRLARELRRQRDSLDGFTVFDSVTRRPMRLLDASAWPGRDEILVDVVDYAHRRQLEVGAADGDERTDQELIARVRFLDLVQHDLAQPTATPERSAAGSTAAGSVSRRGTPTIVVGHSGFPEQVVLAELYAQALRPEGFDVRVRGGLVRAEAFGRALDRDMINMFPGYVGVICTDLAEPDDPPPTAEAAYDAARRWAAAHRCALLRPSASHTLGCVVVRTAFAREHGLATIADLGRLEHFRYGGEARLAGADGLRTGYGLDNFTFCPLPPGPPYAKLDAGDLDAVAGVTTDGQLAGEDHLVLTDPANLFGFNQIAPVVAEALLAGASPVLAATLERVTGLLRPEAMIGLNRATQLDEQDPGTAAAEFLRGHGLPA